MTNTHSANDPEDWMLHYRRQSAFADGSGNPRPLCGTFPSSSLALLTDILEDVTCTNCLRLMPDHLKGAAR